MKREIFALCVLDTGIALAEENMRCDEALLEALDPRGSPLLHFYQWKTPSLTYGYFIAPQKYLDLEKIQKRGLALARRPTGGGIVFHLWDFAFSLLVPAHHPAFSLNPLDNYRFVNGIVLEVVDAFCHKTTRLIPEDAAPKSPNCRYFCMAKPTQYDVVYRGKKVAGAAQRKKRQGYLHQGTISLALPEPELLGDVLLSESSVLEAMLAHTFAPLGKSGNLGEARREVQRLLEQKFREKLEQIS